MPPSPSSPQAPEAPPPSSRWTGSRGRQWRDLLMQRQPVEYTPANSVYEQDVGALSAPNVNLRTAHRVGNGILHIAVAGMLMAIMMEYIIRSEPKADRVLVDRDRDVVLIDVDPDVLDPTPIKREDDQCRALAIAIIVITGVDVMIDGIHTLLFFLRWTTYALLPRLLLGMGYLSIFMAHVGLQKVFPPGYTYWGLGPDYAGPVVYLFLWALGVWDMLQVCIHRHVLGQDSRRWRDQYKRWRESRPRATAAPETNEPTVSGARDGAPNDIAITQVSRTDLESGEEEHDPNSISLRDRGIERRDNKSIGTASTAGTTQSTAGTEARPPDDEIRHATPMERG